MNLKWKRYQLRVARLQHCFFFNSVLTTIIIILYPHWRTYSAIVFVVLWRARKKNKCYGPFIISWNVFAQGWVSTYAIFIRYAFSYIQYLYTCFICMCESTCTFNSYIGCLSVLFYFCSQHAWVIQRIKLQIVPEQLLFCRPLHTFIFL